MTNTTSSDQRERDPAEIESDIERTRERMTQDIDAIGEKLSPEHLRQRAREAVTDAKEAIVEKGRDMSTGFIDLVRENPVPAAVAGIGLYWLFSRRKSGSRRFSSRRGENWGQYPYRQGRGTWKRAQDTASETYGNVTERASEAYEGAKGKVREWVDEAGEKMDEWKGQASQASNRLGDLFDQSPLVAAAGVAVMGAIVGLSIPETEMENEMMGGVRDDLVDRVSDVARQTKDTLGDKMSEVAEGTPGRESQKPSGSGGNPGSSMGSSGSGSVAGSSSGSSRTGSSPGGGSGSQGQGTGRSQGNTPDAGRSGSQMTEAGRSGGSSTSSGRGSGRPGSTE